MKDLELAIKELGINGMDYMSDGCIAFSENGKKYKSKIKTQINYLKYKYKNNNKEFNNLLKDLSNNLTQCEFKCDCIYDRKLTLVFINAVKDIYKLANFMYLNTDNYNFIKKHNIMQKLKFALNRDYTNYNKSTMLYVINSKSILDWIFRKNQKNIFLTRLLKYISTSNINKEARGIQGPWGNLDLPMEERVFEWSDVAEETRGRTRDKMKQYRYRLGLEDYNKTGKVGEGFYWREYRMEPYSWENRFDSSPYAQLRNGTWR